MRAHELGVSRQAGASIDTVGPQRGPRYAIRLDHQPSGVFYTVEKYTGDGSRAGQVIIRESGDRNPGNVATDSADYVYVGTYGSDPGDLGTEIQKFSSTGEFVTRWGSGGTGDGQFGSTPQIAVDSRGNVYVADTGNHRIQKFRPVE